MELITKQLEGEASVVNDEGSILAVFAVEDVIDRDGDVFAPGAIQDGIDVPILNWGHNKSAPPIGVGHITRSGNELYIEGRIFTDTSAGRDAFTVLKNLSSVQKWSFGFLGEAKAERRGGEVVRVITSALPVEVSPVVVPAMPLTRTVAVKELGDSNERAVLLNALRTLTYITLE